MRFKVGDKVKLVRTDDEESYYKNYLGKIYTIRNFGFAFGEKYAHFEETGYISPYLKNLELVKKEYTYEDLKQSPIGTKITFESGNIIIKVKENYYCNNLYFRNDNDLKGLKDTISLNKIIKIEEPIYTTVYEKKEILDEAEKRYLRNFIRPFRDEVYYITKHEYYVDNIKYYRISIVMKNDDDIYLPRYNKKMYKGMETNKKYTIKELGI